MKTSIEREIGDAVRKIISTRSKEDQMPIGWIAGQALKEIDPSDRTPAKPKYCALMHLKQVTMSALRAVFDPTAPVKMDSGQGVLPFTGFQDHYPVPEKNETGDHQYLAFRLLSPDQLLWNAERLERSGASLVRHAEALRAEAALREKQAGAA